MELITEMTTRTITFMTPIGSILVCGYHKRYIVRDGKDDVLDEQVYNSGDTKMLLLSMQY